MVDIVLVHGAFLGGWCWRELAQRLGVDGHRIFTPTLASDIRMLTSANGEKQTWQGGCRMVCCCPNADISLRATG